MRYMKMFGVLAVAAVALMAFAGTVSATEGLQWVMNGYLLTIAVLMVTAGRLGTCSGASGSF
jgi:hypothetical protein